MSKIEAVNNDYKIDNDDEDDKDDEDDEDEIVCLVSAVGYTEVTSQARVLSEHQLSPK